MKLIIFLVLSALFATVICDMTFEEQEFKAFQKKFGRSYATKEEYNKRFKIFTENLHYARELDAKDPHASWGVTQFSDLSKAEFRQRFLIKNFTSPKIRGEEIPVFDKPLIKKDMPDTYDWRSTNNSFKIVSDVYNQLQCGSCWAFSITENSESMWALAKQVDAPSLSMQQVVDCDTTDDGCNGGNPPYAYEYVIKAGGFESYADYPYTGKDGKCVFDKSKIVASISDWSYITRVDDETAMQTFTYTYGPPSICVDAEPWQHYTGGVITRAQCPTQLDHCVQLVGWTTFQGTDAWIVRNSWGTDWGYSGYLYVQRGTNACGIGNEVTTSKI